MLLTEIKAYLVANVTALTANNVYLHQYPDNAPDTLVVLRESGGAPPTYQFNGVTFERPSFQVVARGPNTQGGYAAARALANSVYTVLANTKNATLSTVYYNRITPNQSPFDVGEDSHERPLISCNYLAEKALSTS